MKSSRDTDMILAMSKYQLNHPDRKQHVKQYMTDRVNQLLKEKEVENPTDMNEENKSE
ncbi:hypothetical protein [Mucilaginibacter achroorhodeus]|uniref:hypothetical protein n=1 Tax=Mucilaginibacter achroorhodeus TaxID=2599294 RepID=UPI001648EA7A|nr:hypothetical protein [Mucilaginibacter achroorhodeus]